MGLAAVFYGIKEDGMGLAGGFYGIKEDDMGLADDFYELEEEEWEHDHAYYALRLKKLKNDQEELALEVIHLNNRRKFTLACYCIGTTMDIASAVLSCYFFQRGQHLDYLLGALVIMAFVIPLTIYCIVGWVKCIRDEKKRSRGIERLKTIQSEIDILERKVLY